MTTHCVSNLCLPTWKMNCFNVNVIHDELFSQLTLSATDSLTRWDLRSLNHTSLSTTGRSMTPMSSLPALPARYQRSRVLVTILSCKNSIISSVSSAWRDQRVSQWTIESLDWCFNKILVLLFADEDLVQQTNDLNVILCGLQPGSSYEISVRESTVYFILFFELYLALMCNIIKGWILCKAYSCRQCIFIVLIDFTLNFLLSRLFFFHIFLFEWYVSYLVNNAGFMKVQ